MRAAITIIRMRPESLETLKTRAPPPKELDNHVSLVLTNDSAKFEGASSLREGGNRVLQTPETLQTPGHS